MIIDIDEYAEGAVILDGLDEAIIGITEEFGNGPRILYSKPKIIEILMSQGMENDEAYEYYDYNILGLYAGEQNAIFLDIHLEPKKDGDTIMYYSK